MTATAAPPSPAPLTATSLGVSAEAVRVWSAAQSTPRVVAEKGRLPQAVLRDYAQAHGLTARS